MSKIENCGADTIEAHGWSIQHGYVFRVVAADETAWECEQVDSDGNLIETLRFGYHGNDVSPCGADYLYGGDDELIVIASESDPDDIDTVDGFTLERVILEPGDHRHDGTWEFRVLSVGRDGETILAGKC